MIYSPNDPIPTDYTETLRDEPAGKEGRDTRVDGIVADEPIRHPRRRGQRRLATVELGSHEYRLVRKYLKTINYSYYKYRDHRARSQ